MLCLLSVAACMFLLLFPHAGMAKTDNVAIISSSNAPIYKNVISTIKKSVIKNNSNNVTFQTFYADNLATTAITTINNADLLITIGRAGMLSILRHKVKPPILATLVPRQSFKINQTALKAVNKKIAAIYIDSPAVRQIFLAKILLGERQRISILFSSQSSENKQHIVSILKKAGLNYHIDEVSSPDNIVRKLSLALDNSNTLLALPDPLIFNRNTARNILLTTYRQRIPIIGFSANYVKAGALAAAFSTPEQVAQQTGETAAKILNTSSFPYGGKYPNEFDIAINANVARSLGINTPPIAQIKNKLKILLEKYK